MSATLNDPNAYGNVVSPRIRVMVGGAPVDLAISAEISDSSNFHASRCTIKMSAQQSGTGSLDWWSSQTSTQIAVQIGLAQADGTVPTWTQAFSGQIDDVHFDMVGGDVSVDCRDLVALLMDNRSAVANLNQTASAIVTKLAQGRGLTPNVKATTQLVSRYYTGDRTLSMLHHNHKLPTEWEVIVALARLEGMDAWVNGTTLNWQPPPDPSSTPYLIQQVIGADGTSYWNALRVNVTRSMTLAKGVRVTVESWNSRLAKRHVAHHTASGGTVSSTSPSAGAVTQAPSLVTTPGSASVGQKGDTEYVLVRPGLTAQQAQALAQAIYNDIMKHQVVVSADLWPDLILSPHVVLQLTGTDTDFDAIYYPDTVTRRIGPDGWSMTMTAKNKPPIIGDVTGE